jgi:hypothetical protein
MNKLRKSLVVGVMVLTVLATSGVFNISAVKASASAGDLIKMSGNAAVYYLGADGKRYVFPNSTTYNSWYADFSGVVTIPATELQSYLLGGNVVMRPGTKMVKITTDPSVYAVEPNGVLRKIQSEAQAAALYGSNWNKKIVDVADSYFTNYTIGTALANGEVPAGTLVKNAGSAAVYYYDGTNYRSVASEAALSANRFDMANILTISNTITAGGSAITGAETALVKTSQGATTGTTPVVTGSGVMVSLNSTTPAASDLPAGTSNTMLKFNVTAANDGNAVISGVKLTAIGLGTPSEIKSISVYKDNVKLNSTARDIDSNKEAQINFTNAVTISAGATVTFEVRATILAGTTGKHGLSIAKAADVMAGNTVSGSFPVAGNIFSGVNVTVGTLTITNDSALSDVKLGDKGATLAKFKLANNANIENIVVKAVTIKKDSASEASDSAIENLKLNFDGTVVATAASISSRYVTFVLANPITISKNTSNKRLTVTGDVVDGAGKTIGFTVDSASDVVATGDYYGYQSIVALPTPTLFTNIKAGTISVEKVNAANDKLRVDVDNQEIGSFKITANSGKNAELSTLRLTITSSNDLATPTSSVPFAQIENVEVYNKTNNTVYDLTYTGSGAGTKVYQNTSMGLMLTSGVTNELVVRFDTLANATNQDYTVKIANALTDLIIKETGNDTAITDITPNTVELKKVTVEGAGSTFSINALSNAYTAVIGTADVEVANFSVKAAQNSKAFMRDLTVSAAGTLVFNTHSVSDVKLWKGTTLVKTMSSSQIGGSAVTFTDLNEEIAANTTVNYKVTVSFVKNTDLNGSSTAITLASATMEDVDGKTISATGLPLTSARTVTLQGTGSLYVAMDTNDVTTNKDTYAVAGTMTGAIASLKMRANNEAVKVTKLTITGTTNLNGKVTELGLYDGSTLVGSTNVIATSSTIDISGDKLIVPMTAKNYYIKATLAPYGKDQTGSLNVATTFAVSAIEAQGNDSGDSLTSNGGNVALLESGEIAYDVNNDGVVAAGSTTGTSSTLGILASKISAVSLVSSNGSGTSLATKIYSGQAANAAIIQVTTGASANNETNGDAIKTYLNSIIVKVATSTKIDAFSATIERIGGTAPATTTTSITAKRALFSGLTGSDYEIAPSATAYFLVKVTPTFTTAVAGDSSLNVSLDALDTDNFTFKDSRDANAKSELRLGVTTVDGTTISN